MRDREALQSWYREAMLRRIDELVALRERLEEGAPGTLDDLRKVGQALRGSGGTFGFPELTKAASVVERTSDVEALRRCEGLLVELRRLADDQRDEGRRVYEWLARCVAPGDDEVADAILGAHDVDDAWGKARGVAGVDDTAVTRRIADRFGLEVADLGSRSRAAQRLVPEALMASERIVPLREDSETITVATANPVSLPTEVEVQRLTGRRARFAVAPPTALGTSGADAPEPPSTSTSDGERRGVLVVDDEPSARLLVRRLLEKRGFTAVEAGDGLEALEVIRQHDDVALAVVDLKMPRMDGLELMWELRDAGRWGSLPVIVVTGERDDVLETQIMEEGADDYIRKPLDPRLFLARVEATLRRASHRTAS